MNSRKSKLASGILEAITRFFNSSDFINQPMKIRDYVRWAIRDGPAYYKFPTPQASKVVPGTAGYQVIIFLVFIICPL